MGAPTGVPYVQTNVKQYFAAGHEDAGPDVGYVTATPGTESGNAIDTVCAIFDSAGNAVTSAKRVYIESLAVTDNAGDIAAATSAVGTLNKANNPATGPNVAFMTSTAAGLFSFKVTNANAELNLVRITAEGCRPLVLALDFAAV